MPRRREVPYSPIPSSNDSDEQHHSGEPPGRPMQPEAAETLFAALMQAAPHEEVGWSKEDLLPLREVIEDAIDRLSERKRWIFNACIVERKPLAAIAADLGLTKSYVHRLRDQAICQLRALLEDEPLIKEYLCR